jgi:hypothetical protein
MRMSFPRSEARSTLDSGDLCSGLPKDLGKTTRTAVAKGRAYELRQQIIMIIGAGVPNPRSPESVAWSFNRQRESEMSGAMDNVMN